MLELGHSQGHTREPILGVPVNVLSSTKAVECIFGWALRHESRTVCVCNVHSVTTNAGITLGPVLAQLMTTEILDDTEVDVLAPYRADRFGQAPH